MIYKKMGNTLSFADLALATFPKHDRSLILMNKINGANDWFLLEEILMAHYTFGTSGEGADTYPPLLLFKCTHLQKWFRINSDPELENQINYRLFITKFLGISFDRPSQTHSTLKYNCGLDSKRTIKKDIPRYNIKEHGAVDTTLSEASVNDTNYLDYCMVFSKHIKTPVKKVYADKGYAGIPNREFPQAERKRLYSWYRQTTHNIQKGLKILKLLTVHVDGYALKLVSG